MGPSAGIRALPINFQFSNNEKTIFLLITVLVFGMSDSPQATFASTKLIVHDLEEMARFYCAAYGFEQTGWVELFTPILG